jgi:pimeloyl-ACP methyl ester carboxylesterase
MANGILDTISIEANGLTFELIEAGRGGRPLLILHGFCGSKESFEDVIEPLARSGWHVVVPDQRGHGKSDHLEGADAYGVHEFIEDVRGITGVLGWGRFVLLGHSMGGMIAQHFALAEGARLDGLILMDTFYKAIKVDPQWAELGRQLVEKEGLSALVDAMHNVEGPLVTPAHRRLLIERPGYQDELDGQLMACSVDMWLAMTVQFFGAPDVLKELGSLRVPTLVMVGEQDQPFLEGSRRMADAIPGATLAVIPDAGHSPELEAPRAWTSAIERFLNSLPNAA